MDVTTQGLSGIGSTVRLIVLRFSFSNPEVVPLCVRKLPHEKENELLNKSVANGELVIDPSEKVGLVEFLGELEQSGYEMVDATYQPRIDPGNPKRTYHVVRFMFARREYAQPTDQFISVRPTTKQALRTMCEQAMWRVRAFLNPLFVRGETVDGEHAVSVNLEVRKPLFDNVGNPVRTWRKDENGNRLGDAPVPLQPDYVLRLTNSELRILSASK